MLDRIRIARATTFSLAALLAFGLAAGVALGSSSESEEPSGAAEPGTSRKADETKNPVPAPPTDAEGWTEDVVAARMYARANDLDIIYDFTGSDWCTWCIRLHDEVFSTDEFKDEAPKHFVLVKLDFPRRSPQSEEIRKRNAELRDKFGVRGYPTILLLDSSGKVYGKTGYRRGGAEAYLSHLEQMRQVRIERDKYMAAAEKLKGVKRAEALDKALSALANDVVMMAYTDVVEEIVKLDAEGKAGLKSKYEPMLKQAAMESDLQRLQSAARGGDAQAVLDIVDEIIKKHTPEGEMLQRLLVMKMQGHRAAGDIDAARGAATAAIKAAPNSRLAQAIQQYVTNELSAGPPPQQATPSSS